MPGRSKATSLPAQRLVLAITQHASVLPQTSHTLQEPHPTSFKMARVKPARPRKAKIPEHITSATVCRLKQISGLIRFKGQSGEDSSSGWEKGQRIFGDF